MQTLKITLLRKGIIFAFLNEETLLLAVFLGPSCVAAFWKGSAQSSEQKSSVAPHVYSGL